MSRLPFIFIITGMAGFLIFHGASLYTLYDWLEQPLRGPAGWYNVHLFVLGWATMLAMGAIYQLINVILQSNIYSERLGYVHYGLFTAGLVGLLFGFYHGQAKMVAIFATLTFLGILIFVWNMSMTLFRAKKWNTITISAACSILFLLLTGITGMAMGINFVLGWWPWLHERLFHSHIWMGTIGWFGLLITGFSYKMIPMFYLAHNFSTRLQTITLCLWNAAVILGVFSFMLGSVKWLLVTAICVLALAIIVYNVHLLQIRQKRHKKNPGLGIAWSMIGNQALGIVAIAAVLFAVINSDRLLDGLTITLAGWIYLVGWVSFIILCYCSKIVPFLWWTEKYGSRIGKPGTPKMADMINENKVSVLLAVISLSLIVLLAAIALDIQIVLLISGIVFSIASLLYLSLVGYVFAK